MSIMITINVQLTITRKDGKVIVEMIGQCEGEYQKLSLCMIEQKIDGAAQKFGAKRLDDIGVTEPYQFYRGFVFSDEEKKDEFLKDLQKD